MKRSPGATPGRRALAWVGLAALLLLGGSLGFHRWSASRARIAARRAVFEGRYAEARELLDRWLQAAPGAAEVHYLRARVGLGTDRPAEVATGLERARALGHPEPELALLRAIIATKQGRHAEAEPVLRRAFAEARGPDPLLDEALAKAYIETFNLDRAATVIERWRREAPESPKPYLWRAEIDRRRDDEPDALIRDYREALARDPDLLDARLGLADQLRRVHRPDEAAPEYAAYLARKPDDPAAHFGAGRVALDLGDESAAVRHFDRVLELDPAHAPAHLEYAEIDLRRGENALALAHLDRAARAEPDAIKVRYNRSLALARLGRAEEAVAERALVERLRADEAEIDGLRRRLAHSPQDPALQCRAARWMLDHGHAQEGVRWAEKALRDHPGDPEACRLLVDHYQRSGNPGLANYYRTIARPETGRAPPSP